MKSLGKTKWHIILVVLTLCAILGGGCGLFNKGPVIYGVLSQADWVAPSGSSKVECVASDGDGDSLTYTWSATGGSISGKGRAVTWVAPYIQGTYTITVSVTDGKGGEATSHLNIVVEVGNHPPVIESLTAASLVVEPAMSTKIECVASDPDGDELSYRWATTRGAVSGQGTVITWTAPYVCDDYVVAVTIADDRGGEATKELTITVEAG
ncbi:Ig-like domain-containing protein [Chloroflexota bacterium]